MAPARVLLLDLRARASGFVGDPAVRSLVAAVGDRLEVVSLCAEDDPDGFLVRLEREAKGADVVIVSRAWERAIPDALRRGGPGAHLVRLTRGIRSPVDDAFDAVLDPAGVADLLAGRAPAEARFVRPSVAALRAAPNTPVGVAGADLPTLSGPSTGCPYLRDARESPAFARVPLDRPDLQPKGCSFCLDNHGAYAAHPTDVVVAAWLDGARRVRAERPDARQILLTDERPHAALAPFFDAVAADPTLAGLELLWKSRADWLLQYEDDVARACAAAERSGSVLHLYLVGFESFDRGELERFNKGHGPEVNARAVERLRALAARFPRSFVFAPLRAHGIVLFTPWTTPEALLENARWMRALRFDELRAHALRTRLRLYPRVPLHALAEADGLLAPAFEPGRDDRAKEQGYDASAPWRFADPRVEAIQQAAHVVADATGVLEADALEVTTRFVLSWPALARAPSAAYAAVLVAPEAWGAPLAAVVRALGPTAAAFDPELEALRRGERRAALKESVPAALADDLVTAYRAMGLAARVVARHENHPATGAHTAGAAVAVICAARDEAALTDVSAAFAALAGRDGAAGAVAAAGDALGYPPCCVAAFEARRGTGDNLVLERGPFVARPDAPLLPLVNRLAPVRLVSHHLCAPDCRASEAIAEATLHALASIDPEAAARAVALVSAPALFVDYQRRVSLLGVWEGDAFVVRGAPGDPEPDASDFERMVHRASALRLGPDRVVLAPHDRALSARRPLLVVPGEALAPAAARALSEPLPLPPLPRALRPGVRAGAFVLADVRRGAEAYDLTLARAAARVTLRLRPHEDGTAYTVRKGAWAVDVEGAERLDEAARAALALVVRAL